MGFPSANPQLTLYSLYSWMFSPMLLSLALRYSDVRPFAKADPTEARAACSAGLTGPCTRESDRGVGMDGGDHCNR